MRHTSLLLLLATAGRAAAGPCLKGGAIAVCEDPVKGTAAGAQRTGGTLLTDGWRVDKRGDSITYDLGATINSGAVRFAVSGISDAALTADTHIVFLLNDSDSLKTVHDQIEVLIWGSAVDPNAVGTLNLGVGDPAQGVTKRKQLPWTGATHQLDIAFDEPTQTVTLALDGAALFTIDARKNGVPTEMRYRYAHLALPCCLSNNAYQPVVGADYTLLSVVGSPAPAPVDMAGPVDMAAPRDMAEPTDLAKPAKDAGDKRDLAEAPDLGADDAAAAPADLASAAAAGPDAGAPPSSIDQVRGGCAIGGRAGGASIGLALAALAALLLRRRL
jgi:hypothetical protein